MGFAVVRVSPPGTAYASRGIMERFFCRVRKKVLPYRLGKLPELTIAMDDPKVAILIFSNGKLVCTGAKKEGEVHRAVTKLQDMFEEKIPLTY